MNRVRLAHALALLGILITTGGCAESATAPEATLPGTALEAKSSTTPPAPTPPVTEPGEGDASTTDSGWMTGGGRAEQP